MSNLASILRAEIARVARKEARRETAALKKASATYRSEIAALKRRAAEMERQLRSASRKAQAVPGAAADAAPVPEGMRFSAKGLSTHRKRLGLSAGELGLLIGASSQSIYNWESGKARPQRKFLPILFALRTVGKKETMAQLAARKSAA